MTNKAAATILISPDSSPQYYSYYLDGLTNAIPGARVRYSVAETPRLTSPRDGLAVVLPSGRRLFIAADDHPTVNLAALSWCDVYGQVNLESAQRNQPGGNKLLALGPGFGTRQSSSLRAIAHVLGASARGGRSFAGPLPRARAIAKHQRDRLPLCAYRPQPSSDDTLFFLASFWHQHPQANNARIDLWSALQHTGLKLEGGFVGAKASIAPRLQASETYDLTRYIQRTQHSVVALNTPAVHGCLGWKLGEFFALGKAIVSLPLSREMPGGLDSGEQILIVETPDEAADAVCRLAGNQALRTQLERNARQYFDAWLSPMSIAHRLIGPPQ